MRISLALTALALLSCTNAAPAVTPCATADITHCLATQQSCNAITGSAVCSHCPDGMHASAGGLCVAIVGTPIEHDFPDQTVSAGMEQLGNCRSWTLGNAADLWVTGVELTQHESSHHSNWTYVPEGLYAGPDGIWPCASRNYDQLTAAVSGGVLYAQSTQATHETQVFPDGAAIRIPAHSVIVSDIHLLNLTQAPVTGHVSMTIYTIPRAQVQIPLTPFHITYDTLDLPPHTHSRVEMTCNLASGFMQQTGHPLDARLFYALPHTHALGTRVFLSAIGGPLDGQTLLDVQGTPGEARGVAYNTPVDLTGVTSFHFGCEFDNPTADVVHWGFGNQEMCEMLGFMQSPVAFEGRLTMDNPAGMDGTTALFSGGCNMTWVTLASGM
jgi:hypothetical protein